MPSCVPKGTTYHVQKPRGRSILSCSQPSQLSTSQSYLHLLQNGLKMCYIGVGWTYPASQPSQPEVHQLSAAALSGITTATIMERAGWSQRNTSSAFYHKPTMQENVAAQFSKAVLKGKGYKHACQDMLIDRKPLKCNYRMANAMQQLQQLHAVQGG